MPRSWRPQFYRENRIYIVPTGRGVLFLGLLIVMIFVAAAYNNNLIFLLTCFLASLFVVSMLQTHATLNGLSLRCIGAEDAFEGDSLRLLFEIKQRRARLRGTVKVVSRSRQFFSTSRTVFTLRAEERSKAVRTEISAWRRGIHALPEFFLETEYPLGLFHAWMIFRPQAQVIVYPRAEGARELDLDDGLRGELDSGLRHTPDGDFGELKAYREGESYHQIAWKHYARTQKLLSKVHWGSDRRHYRIPWSPYPGEDLESYLQ